MVKCNVPIRGGRAASRLPQRGRHLHGVHDAGFPDKYMPFMDEDRWGGMASKASRSSRSVRSCADSSGTSAKFDVEPSGAGQEIN